MKKLICIVICLAIVFSFGACHNVNSNNITTEPVGDYNNLQVTDDINYESTTTALTTMVSESATDGVQIPTVTQKNTGSTAQASTTRALVTTTAVSVTKETPTTTKASTTTKAPTTTQKTTTTTQVSLPVITESTTIAVCLHKNTVLINKVNATANSDGYTGDTCCADCGAFLIKGEKVKYEGNNVQEGMVQYPCPDGSTITVPVGTNVFDYTMKNAGKTASHDFYELENELFRLFNEERARLGISAVSNNENAYYYVKMRAIEIQAQFSHTRPDGNNFSGIYEDEGVILCAMAENIGLMTVQEGEDIAYKIFNSVMNSPAHKATALDAKYNQMSIAVTYCDGQYYFCQHMYENVVH